MPAKCPRTGDSSRRSRRARTQKPGRGSRQEPRPSDAHSSASVSASSTAGSRTKEPRLLPHRPISRNHRPTSGHGKRQKEVREATPASLAHRSYFSPRKFQDLAAAALRIVEQHFAIPHVQTRQRRQENLQVQQDRDKSQEVFHRRDYEPGWHLEELASHEPDSDVDEGEDAEDSDEAEPGVVYESRETDWGYTKPVVIDLEDSDGCSDEDEYDTPVEDRAAWLRAVRGA